MATRALLFSILLLSPLPFGSARPIWQWSWLILIALCSLLIASRRTLQRDPRWPERAFSIAPKDSRFVTWLLLALGGWIMLQTLIARDALSAISAFSLSGFSEATLTSASYFLSYLLLFYLAMTAVRSKQTLRKTVRLITIFVALYSLFGFFVYAFFPNKILWFDRWNSWSLSATFVNRNSFASFAGMGLLCSTAFLFYLWRKHTPEDMAGSGKLRHTLRLLGSELWLYAAAASIITVALLLSASRGGIASTFVALVVFIFLMNLGASRRKTLGLIAIMGMVLVSFLALSGEMVVDRMSGGVSEERRFILYPVVLQQIADAPFWGIGFGQFNDAFPLYRTPDFPNPIRRAHSDYLEFIYTAGWPAFFALMAVFSLIAMSFKKALASSEQYKPFFALGLALMVHVGVHSLIDFPLQVPAVGMMFVILIASIYSASLLKRTHQWR